MTDPLPPDVAEKVAALTDEQTRDILLVAWGEKARLNFDLDCYEAFHWCVYGHFLEEHEKKNLTAYFEEWEKSVDEGIRGVMNKAARGLFKSTDTIGFLLFAIGHFPQLSHLVIQARDKDTQKTNNFIADTIERNKGWKACFPNVIPDKERGWSLNGLHIRKTYNLELVGNQWRQTDIDYDDWVQTITNDHKRDPSVLCVSVIAGSIGMHPTGCLVMDDIHDSKNTESMAEMASVVNTVKSDIIPTMSNPGRKPILLVAYTPWKTNDTYAMLEETGLFRQLETPAFTVDPDSDIEFRGEKIRLTCPQVYSLKVLEQQYKILGHREFGRQLRIDLAHGTADPLPYYTYGLSGDEYNWPIIAGADPNGTEKDRMTQEKKLSHFGIAYIAENPMGGAIVLDGFLERCSYGEADSQLLAAQTKFKNYKVCYIESVGTGEAYWEHVRKNMNLKVVASNLVSIDPKGRKVIRSKDNRVLDMAVWFENGTMKLSDRDSEFMRQLRFLFTHFYELDKNTAHPAWDAGDAVYAAMKGIPHILKVEKIQDEINQPRNKPRVGLGSAWNSFGGKR